MVRSVNCFQIQIGEWNIFSDTAYIQLNANLITLTNICTVHESQEEIV